MSTADGSQVVFGTGRGLGLVSNIGGPIRNIPVGGGCTPIRLRSRQQILAWCGAAGSSHLDRIDLITRAMQHCPLRTRATLVTILNAFELPSGTYATAVGACGSLNVVRLNPDGTVSPVPMPLPRSRCRPSQAR